MAKMILLKIQAVPNQTLSVDIDGVSFDISLKTAGTIIADITVDQVVKVQGAKCLPNKPIMPYEYLEHGNFFFITENEEYPDYTQFNISQSLVYLTVDEMVALRA